MLDRGGREDGGGESSPYPLMYVGRSSMQISRDFGERLEALRSKGFEVHVLAAPDGGFGDLAERGIHTKSIPVGHRSNLPGLVGAFFIIQAYFLEQRPVLVHGYDGLVAWLAAVAGRRARAPAVFATIDGISLDREDRRPFELGATDLRLIFPGLVGRIEEIVDDALEVPREAGGRRLVEHVGRWVDKFVVTTEREFDALESAEWFPDEKLEIVVGGRGIDVESFDPESDDTPSVEDARARSRVPEQWRNVVGYAGPLVSDAGGLEVLRAIDRLSGERRDTGWLVAEDAVGSPRFLERLRQRQSDGDLVLTDVAEPVFYRALDVLAHPRFESAVPDGLMKGQAMGIPAIAYDTAGAASVIANGQTGRLVPPGDLEEFVRTLGGMLAHPRRMRDFGVRARSRSTKRFDREHVESQVFRLYDTVLESRLQK